MLAFFLAERASAAIVEYFQPSQTATLLESGTTFDTIASEGYVFTYTRDKLFTGGLGGGPIGRAERVPWPTGIEAQAVTEGPALSGARLSIRRADGAEFDLRAFTLKLLANTAATGAHLEIMPQMGGEDAFSEGFMFNVSGFYGGSFYFNTTTPAYLGNTTPLQGYDSYKLGLFVDFALTSLTLHDASIPEPGAAVFSMAALITLGIGRRRHSSHGCSHSTRTGIGIKWLNARSKTINEGRWRRGAYISP